MEVSKLTITNNNYDELPLAIVKYIHDHPYICKRTTRYKISKAISLVAGTNRQTASNALSKLMHRGVVKVIYDKGGSAPKAGMFYVDTNYPGVKQMLEPEKEAEPTESEAKEISQEPEVIQEPEITQEPQTIVPPVEATVDGQTITVNITINLRR